MVYKFFDKKSASRSGIAINEIKQNLKLAEELYKPIIRNLKKRVYSEFKDNFCADLADMKLLRKLNKGFRFLLWIIDVFSKYAWVVPLKDKKSASIVNAFQKILNDSASSEAKSKGRRQSQSKRRKPNKISVDKGNEFYNNSFRQWLKHKDIEMYSIHNEGKPVVPERFIRNLKTKFYKYMTSI